MTGWDIKGPNGLWALLGPVAVCLTRGGRESSKAVAVLELKAPLCHRGAGRSPFSC